MNIFNKPIQRITQIYQEFNRTEKTAGQKPASRQDEVVLSKEAKELQAINKQLYSSDEVSSRAQELKASVEAGTYKVSGRDIAASMLKSLNKKV